MNLESYKPVIDTSEVSDEALELWYGEFGKDFYRYFENCDIELTKRFNQECFTLFKQGHKICEYNFEKKTLIFYFWQNLMYKHNMCISTQREYIIKLLNFIFNFEIIMLGYYC